MNFFSENPMSMPHDAQYFFDVTIINVAVRRSKANSFESIWDTARVTNPRPVVFHIFAIDDSAFADDEKWKIDLVHHAVLEIRPTPEVSFFLTDKAREENDEDGQFRDPNKFWRF